MSVRIGFDGFDFYTESSVQTDCFLYMHLAEHVLSCKSGILICRTICTAALSISYMLFEEVLPRRSNPHVTDLVVPWMCCYGISSVVRFSQPYYFVFQHIQIDMLG